VLRRVGLNTRSKRLALIARYRDPYERKPDLPPSERHIDASEPGEKVQLDCFLVGRLSGAHGTVWQYTAIGVTSAFCWAELHTSERNPRARHTRERVHRVAAELVATGWAAAASHRRHGSEFRVKGVGAAVERSGDHQRFIRAGQFQRLRRTRPTDRPRRTLAAGVRPLNDPESTTLANDLAEYTSTNAGRARRRRRQGGSRCRGARGRSRPPAVRTGVARWRARFRQSLG
jgi:hypothetical protein